MLKIEHLLGSENRSVVCGVTMVDTSVLPWPGASFAEGPMANSHHVATSYNLLADCLGIDRSMIGSVHQVHGRNISEQPTGTVEQADALMTNVPGMVIGVKVADCLGLLIYDPVHHAVAAVHSGWRGTAQKIGPETVRAMQARWGSRPEDLIVAFSPSAGGDRYEVGEDVYKAMPRSCKPLANKEGKWLFNNQAEVIHDLLEVGLDARNLNPSSVCTIQDSRFHSHRRDRERAGRCFAFIGLKNP